MKVSVCCRVRPLPKDKESIKKEKEQAEESDDSNSNRANNNLTLLCSQEKKTISISNSNGLNFLLDNVFDEKSTQEEVFNSIMSPLVISSFEGINCTLFSYGQTGSGKTFTLQGKEQDYRSNNNSTIVSSSYEDRGIIPRTAEMIFKEIDTRTANNNNINFEIKISIMEIYKEKLYDLLSLKAASSSDTVLLRIREQQGNNGASGANNGNSNGGVWVEGLIELRLQTEQDFHESLYQALKRRTTASHSMNSTSSRSHLIVIIMICQNFAAINGSAAKKIFSKIHLIDLAGSEMVRKTDATGKRLEEAKHINKSLSALGKVIFALTTAPTTSAKEKDPQLVNQPKQSQHIPYRDSKLTRLLQDSLGGNSRTLLVLAVSASRLHIQESIATLRFGERARQLRTKPTVNTVIDDTHGLKKALIYANKQIMALTATVTELQDQLKLFQNNQLKNTISSSSTSNNNNNKDKEQSLRQLSEADLFCQACNDLIDLSNKNINSNLKKQNQKNISAEDIVIVKKDKTNFNLFPSINKDYSSHGNEIIPEISIELSKQEEIIKNKLELDDEISSRCAVCGLNDDDADILRRETAENLGEMFTCDGNCGCCFHARCVGLVGDAGQYACPDGEWFCSSCTYHASGVDEVSGLLSLETSSAGISTGLNNSKEDKIKGQKQTESSLLASVKAEYHLMRRERNRILLQWQQEKRVNSILDERRQNKEKERDIELVTFSEENRKLQKELDFYREECDRLKKASLFYSVHSNDSLNNNFNDVEDKEAMKSRNDRFYKKLIGNSNNEGKNNIRPLSPQPPTSLSNTDKENIKESPSAARSRRYTSSDTNSPIGINVDKSLLSPSSKPAKISDIKPINEVEEEKDSGIPKPWKKNNKKISMKSQLQSQFLSRSAEIPYSNSYENLNSDENLKPNQCISPIKDKYNSPPQKLEKEKLLVDSFNSENSDTFSLDDDNGSSKYLHPLKSRLQELLKSVQEETGSYSELRKKYKNRGEERNLLKASSRSNLPNI